MAIQSRSEARTRMLEGAVLNALVVLLVATLAAVIASYVSPIPVSVTPPVTESQSLVDFRAGEKGFMSAEQQSLIDFRAGERP